MMKALLAVVAVLSLSACSAPEPDDGAPPVATLAEPSASAAPAPSSAAPAQQRPRARLDGTDADFEALAKPFYKCMAAHGALQGEKQGWVGGDDVPQEIAKAQKACEQFWPLQPWELDAANPEAKDFARDVVKCLKRKGVKEVATGDDGLGIVSGGEGNDAGSIAKTGQFLDACYREVAAR